MLGDNAAIVTDALAWAGAFQRIGARLLRSSEVHRLRHRRGANRSYILLECSFCAVHIQMAGMLAKRCRSANGFF